jgi:hypothetical protein
MHCLLCNLLCPVRIAPGQVEGWPPWDVLLLREEKLEEERVSLLLLGHACLFVFGRCLSLNMRDHVLHRSPNI